jgi:hypothetical protein
MRARAGIACESVTRWARRVCAAYAYAGREVTPSEESVETQAHAGSRNNPSRRPATRVWTYKHRRARLRHPLINRRTLIVSPSVARNVGPRKPRYSSPGACGLRTVKLASVYSWNTAFHTCAGKDAWRRERVAKATRTLERRHGGPGTARAGRAKRYAGWLMFRESGQQACIRLVGLQGCAPWGPAAQAPEMGR